MIIIWGTQKFQINDKMNKMKIIIFCTLLLSLAEN